MENLKAAIVAAAIEMERTGLSPVRSGNISVRSQDGMLITASGIHPRKMKANTDVVHVDGSGGCARGQKKPSSEWRFHQAIYEARPDVGSVVHCHSRFATALACLHEPIPAFHYMVAKAGGEDIPLVPYATFGSHELAASAAAALKARDACILANHGQIAAGATLEDALELAEEVEVLAAQYIAARSVGSPVLLTHEQMALVVEKFKTYGQKAKLRKNPRRSKRR